MPDIWILALQIAWVVIGAAYLLHWKFKQPEEVTLLDLAAALILGAIFGAVVPLVAFLYSVKIRAPKESP